ncbi:MAG: hypothetical protein NZO58_09830 [Gemmataceae bacterium]|nr:hypothetical protein [Gemmataceae bacterium]
MSLMCARVRPRSVAELGRRESDRHVTNLEVLARPLDTSDVISWGATVRDISSNGIGLNLCYPFPPGT